MFLFFKNLIIGVLKYRDECKLYKEKTQKYNRNQRELNVKYCKINLKAYDCHMCTLYICSRSCLRGGWE
jgi:hypothetical protein